MEPTKISELLTLEEVIGIQEIGKQLALRTFYSKATPNEKLLANEEFPVHENLTVSFRSIELDPGLNLGRVFYLLVTIAVKNPSTGYLKIIDAKIYPDKSKNLISIKFL